MDSLLIDEVAGRLTADQREQAIDQLLELGGAVTACSVSRSSLMWTRCRQTATGRTFTDAERDEIRTHQRRAYRWTFLVSGLQHPNFVRIVDQLTDIGAEKIAAARAGAVGLIGPYPSLIRDAAQLGAVPGYIVAYPARNDVGDSPYAPHVPGDLPCSRTGDRELEVGVTWPANVDQNGVPEPCAGLAVRLPLIAGSESPPARRPGISREGVL